MSVQNRLESLAFEKFSFPVLQNPDHFALPAPGSCGDEAVLFGPPDPVLRR